MGEIVEGVIHGKTIELAVDPGLQDGGVVQVVNRGSNGCDRASAKDFHEIRAVFTRGVA